jgi:hypothetical protein
MDNEENDDKSTLKPMTDYTSVFHLIDSISNNLSADIPMLKQELYVQLLRLSAQQRRNDLTSRLAEQCVSENVKIGGSMNEIDSLTGYILPRDIVEQLARYKPGEKSWKEKLTTLNLQNTNQSKLEQIYQEAKQDGRHPISLQLRLLDLYIQKKSTQQAFALLHEIFSDRYQVRTSFTYSSIGYRFSFRLSLLPFIVYSIL